MGTAGGKQQIVVLGGGMSSLVAAFEMTSVPGWKQRYDITVYQMGWRLGGKGASGRNRKIADRIEEHGLHIFFGFYENAMGIMRRCYQELGRNPASPLATFDDAFKPHDLIVMEEYLNGQWYHWPLPFPRNEMVPGGWFQPFPDSGETPARNDGDLPTPWSYVEAVLQLGADLFEQWWWRRTQQQISESQDAIERLARSLEGATATVLDRAGSALFDAIMDTVKAQLRLADAVTRPLRDADAFALHTALALVKRMPEDPRRHKKPLHRCILWLLSRFRRWLAEELAPEIESNIESHKMFVMADLACSTATGLIDDGLIFPPTDWRKIDDEDFREWLKRHGGSDIMVHSAPLRALSAAAFSTGVSGGAGTTLHGCMRLFFTYKGAVLWEMQAGMGDTIFAPLYEVLERRGVKFEFFHRVDELVLSPADEDGKRRVARIVMGRQATLAPGRDRYEPLYDVKGLPCWPSEPDYEQLDQGPELARLERLYPGEYNLENWWTRWEDPAPPLVLQADVDFHVCLLGISVGAFPYICKQLIDDRANPRFREMVEHVETTLTQAAQLWLRPELAQLGWPMTKPVVIPYAEPYDTWSDMSHLIPRESWEKTGERVGHIAYLCSRLAEGPDFEPPPRDAHDYPFGQRERAKRDLRQWLRTRVRQIWPHAGQTDDPDCLSWDWLVDLEKRKGVERLESQLCVADWNPSDRYVLSVAGSARYRLLPEESGYENLVLTGDWTLNSFNSGCVEGATESGMRASRAICGYPQRFVGNWLDVVLKDAPPPPKIARRTIFPALRDPTDSVPYIPRPGDLLSAAPVAAHGTTMNCFVLRADAAQLAHMCDAFLNLGPTVYQPLLPCVVFVAVHIDQARPAGVQGDLGFMPERDYAIWVPLKVGRRVAGRFVLDRLAWYHPYMWVDNSAAMNDGREVYGLDKSMATLDGPRHSSHPPRFGVETIVSELNGSRASTAPLIQLQARDRSEFGEHPSSWSSGKDAAQALAPILREALGGDAADHLDLLEQLLTGEQILAGLKQFPAINGQQAACYQAIVETKSHATSMVVGGLIGGHYEVDIKPYPSHDIVGQLGLDTRDLGNGWQRTDSVVNLFFKFDFELGPGREIYRRA